MADAIELHLDGMKEDGIAPPARDGRAAPRPSRIKGRTVSISSRVSPEVSRLITAISKFHGITKTEAVEYSVRCCAAALQPTKRAAKIGTAKKK